MISPLKYFNKFKKNIPSIVIAYSMFRKNEWFIKNRRNIENLMLVMVHSIPTRNSTTKKENDTHGHGSV
jgi:hypothetical protein